MKIKPMRDNVLVEPVVENVTASGIILPDTASKEKPMRGVVVATGPDASLSEGEEVFFSKYGPTEIIVDGKDLLLLSETDVIAKING